MKPVYAYDKRYSRCRPLADWIIRHSFRQLRYIGLERIPQDGAIIFAPNHCNALCDALAVLVMDKSPKVFAARADIFRNKRQAALLHWLKMIPIRRMRDGMDEVRKNDETIALAVETLQHGVSFCMMPEGTHRTKHSLLPLAKGIFRIALQAADSMDKPVYIVPVGLEYADYFRLWDALTVQIGEPIEVNTFREQHASLDYPQLLLALREELTTRMRKTILWVPDDENYEDNYRKLLMDPPPPFAELLSAPLPKGWVRLLLLLSLPLFLLSAALSLPIWLMQWAACRKVKDKAFLNSVRIVINVLLMPLFLMLPWPFWAFTQEWLYWARGASHAPTI